MAQGQITISLPGRYESLFEHVRKKEPSRIDESNAKIVQDALKEYAMQSGFDIENLRPANDEE